MRKRDQELDLLLPTHTGIIIDGYRKEDNKKRMELREGKKYWSLMMRSKKHYEFSKETGIMSKRSKLILDLTSIRPVEIL